VKIKPGRPRKSPTKLRQEREIKYKELLAWFLKFVNEPISENMTRGELFDLSDYFKIFMMGDLALVNPKSEWYSIDFIKQSQECCRNIFKAILQKRNSMKKDSPIDLITFSSQISNLLPPNGLDQISIPFSTLIQYPDTILKSSAIKIEKTFTKKSIYKLILATVDLLSHVYLSRFKICKKPDCKKYFYQKTGKPMNYCSPRCSNWGKYREYNPTREKRNPQVVVECSCGYRRPLDYLEYVLSGESTDLRECDKCKKLMDHIILKYQKGQWEEVKRLNDSEWEEFEGDYQIELDEGKSFNRWLNTKLND
jgi:hypothetical protein